MKIVAIVVWIVSLSFLVFNLGRAFGLKKGFIDGYRTGYIDGYIAPRNEINKSL